MCGVRIGGPSAAVKPHMLLLCIAHQDYLPAIYYFDAFDKVWISSPPTAVCSQVNNNNKQKGENSEQDSLSL